MEFKEISEKAFETYSTQHPNANFWQSVNMAHLREWNGWSTQYVALFDQKEIKGAVMLSYRKVFLQATFVQALRGFLLDYHNIELLDEFHKHLLEYLKQHNCMYFKMDPYLPRIERDINGDIVKDGFNNEYIVEHLKQLGYRHSGYLRGNDDTREPNWMFVLDLKGKTKEQLLKEFDHQTRWSINKTLKNGIQLVEITRDQLPSFKKMMEHTAQRRGFADHSTHYYEGLFQCFQEEGRMKAFCAQLDLTEYETILKQEKSEALRQLQEVENVLSEIANSKKFNKKRKVLLEEIALIEKKQRESEELRKQEGDVLNLACATFMLFGKEVLYLYSGAYDKYMKFNGPYALQWHIICYALEHGYEKYNFYGISGLFDKSADGYGVYEFKKGFTGNVVELIGDFYYEVKPMQYRLYEWLRKIRNALRK